MTDVDADAEIPLRSRAHFLQSLMFPDPAHPSRLAPCISPQSKVDIIHDMWPNQNSALCSLGRSQRGPQGNYYTTA